MQWEWKWINISCVPNMNEWAMTLNIFYFLLCFLVFLHLSLIFSLRYSFLFLLRHGKLPHIHHWYFVFARGKARRTRACKQFNFLILFSRSLFPPLSRITSNAKLNQWIYWLIHVSLSSTWKSHSRSDLLTLLEMKKSISQFGNGC